MRKNKINKIQTLISDPKSFYLFGDFEITDLTRLIHAGNERFKFA